MIRLRQNLGPFSIEVEGDTNAEIVEQLGFWNDLPNRCPACETAVRFFYRSTKERYRFYGLACDGAVQHTTNFGIRKDDGALYYKGDASWQIAQRGRQDDER